MNNWYFSSNGYVEAEHFFVKPTQVASNNKLVLHRYSNLTMTKTDVTVNYTGNHSSEVSSTPSDPVIFGVGDTWMIWPRSGCNFRTTGGVGLDLKTIRPYVSADKGATWTAANQPITFGQDFDYNAGTGQSRTYTFAQILGSQAVKVADVTTWFLSFFIITRDTPSTANEKREIRTYKSINMGQSWSLLPEIVGPPVGFNRTSGPLVVNGSGRNALHATTVTADSFSAVDPVYQQPGQSYGFNYTSVDQGVTWTRVNDVVTSITTAYFYSDPSGTAGFFDSVMFFGNERYLTVNDQDWYPKRLTPSGFRDSGDPYPPPQKSKYRNLVQPPILPDMDYINQKYLAPSPGSIQPNNGDPTAVYVLNPDAFEPIYVGNNNWFRLKVVNSTDPAPTTQRSTDGGINWHTPVGEFAKIFTQKNTMGYCNIRHYGIGK